MQAGENATWAMAGAERRPERPGPYTGFDRMLIGGAWRRGRGDRSAVDSNPFTQEPLVEIPLADLRDVDDACRAAESAYRHWSLARARDRIVVIERAASVIERRKTEIVDWLVRESGSTRAKATLEWHLAHRALTLATQWLWLSEERALGGECRARTARVRRRPIGVAGVITPFNFPFSLTMRAVAPALASGNAVVLKPATDTPVTGGLIVAKVFEEAGLPEGLLNVVVGEGRDVGAALVEHPVPRILSFTGSTVVGRWIAQRAGRLVKRVRLELGNNTPFIVLDDADISLAVDAALAGKFLHQGQVSTAINRILVDARRHDELVERFVERASALRVGDPSDERTEIGPIINQARFEGIVQKLEATIARGVMVALRTAASGLVLPPVVLANVTRDTPAAREELFGPVAPVLPFTSEEEAIRIASDAPFESSAVFAGDFERGVEIARRLDARSVHVNDWPIHDDPRSVPGEEGPSSSRTLGGHWRIEDLTTMWCVQEPSTSRGAL